MKSVLIGIATLITLNTYSFAESKYGNCLEYCDKQEGKRWKRKTPAGACEAGCNWHLDRGYIKATNACSEKYGGKLHKWCIKGIDAYSW